MMPVTYPGEVVYADGENAELLISAWKNLKVEVDLKVDEGYYGELDLRMFQPLMFNINMESGRVIVTEPGKHDVIAKGVLK